MSAVFCPHCDEVEMEHIVVRERTHVYVCPECPNVMFEFSDESNIDDLREYLMNGSDE